MLKVSADNKQRSSRISFRSFLKDHPTFEKKKVEGMRGNMKNSRSKRRKPNSKSKMRQNDILVVPISNQLWSLGIVSH